jgi:Integrase core domain
MGIRDRPISLGSPWQNGCAERLIGTLRCECLDQMLIFGEAHLRRVLSAYAAYTIKRARTWHYRKMHPCIEQSKGLASLSPFQSWPDCITNTSGYDFRKGQPWPTAPIAAGCPD